MIDAAIFDIAIIGGGFSGIAVAAACAGNGQRLAIIERSATLPGGVPFAAASDWHLLNVRAAQMSLDANDPNDFIAFCGSQFGGDPAHYRDQFVSRRRYCQYLQNRVSKLANCHHLIDSATTITHQQDHFVIQLTQSELRAKHLVLALGSKTKPGMINDPRWYVGPWQLRQLPTHDDHDIALIIGSGLSAIDAVQSLLHLGWQGLIAMRSTHALLPAVHAGPDLPQWQLPASFAEQSKDAQQFLRLLHQQLRLAQHSGADWRSVINALRPITARIFASWSAPTRLRVMRRLAWLWTPHRHRMAESVHAAIMQAQRSNQLQIAAARLLGASAAADGIHCQFNTETIRAALVIDARAPNDAVLSHPLLKQLSAQQLIRTQTNYIEADIKGCCNRLGDNQIFTLGALRYGELLETTAVPEIRQQASLIARELG
jgi:uncharacterized NAD(P)/FAD-binding protein YdhS